MNFSGGPAFACYIVIVVYSLVVYAQDPSNDKEQRPAFDAVSIRQMEPFERVSTAGSTSYIFVQHQACVYQDDKVLCRLSLAELICEAYQRKRYEVNGPEWLKDNLFVFQAILRAKTSKEDARLMIQRALEDRFGLRYHFAKKLLPIYEMNSGANGLHLATVDPPERRNKLVLDGRAGASVVRSEGKFSATNIRMDELGFWIAETAGLDRPVLNGTGLDEQYKIELRWAVSDNSDPSHGLRDQGILAALSSQAGLVLRKTERPVDTLVIDHVNRTPTPNP